MGREGGRVEKVEMGQEEGGENERGKETSETDSHQEKRLGTDLERCGKGER